MPSTPKSNRATQFAIWGVALIAILLALYAIRLLTRERISVLATQASYQDLIRSSPTTGKVKPLDDFQAYAQVAGQVQNIYVHIGDKVKAGELLLKMDDTDALASLAHAQFTLQTAELAASNIDQGGTQDERNTYAADDSRAQLQRREDATTLASLEQLQQKGAAAPAEVAAARARLQLDDNTLHNIEQHSTQRYGQADRAHAQADISDARAAIAAAQSAYDTANIRTPISGTIYSLPYSQYDYVNAGDSLVSVANLTHMRITAYFDEPEIGDLAVGQPVTITWEPQPGMRWYGRIIQAPTTIIPYGTTRNVGECFIDVDNADGVLQPGANVTVTVTTAQHLHVLSVPHEAVRDLNGPRPYVFRILHNRLVRTNVQTGIINIDQVEITGGLAEGDPVALNATTNRDLSDGLEVTPVYR